MAQTVCVLPLGKDRARLLASAADRNRPLKHVQRARIILCSAERLPVLEVARRVGVGRLAVWRRQARYAEQGVDGLLRDKTRKPGRAPLSAKVVAKILELTCSEPSSECSRRTGRAVAKAVGVSLRAVQRLGGGPIGCSGIASARSNAPAIPISPRRSRTSSASAWTPPKHAVAVSINEKSQIQALDRTQPSLPLKPGKCGTITHDDPRSL